MKLKTISESKGIDLNAKEIEELCPSSQVSSPDKDTRESGLALLEAWLSHQKELSDNDMEKVWEDLLYCLWHTDSRVWQIHLTKRISSLLEIIHSSMSIRFYEAFLRTLRCKWNVMETRKCDRFYVLLRSCLSAMFRFLQRECWHKEYVKRFNECFLETVLMPKDSYGVNLYLSQVFLDELKNFLSLPSAFYKLMLDPFWKVFSRVEDELLLRRVRDSLLWPLVEEAKIIERNAEENENSLGCLAFNVLLEQRLKRLASSPTTCETSRNIIRQLFDDYCEEAPSFPVCMMKITSPTDCNNPSSFVAILQQEKASDETDSFSKSFDLGSEDVIGDALVHPPEVFTKESPGNKYQTQRNEKFISMDKDKLSSDERVRSLNLDIAATKNGDRNCNQAKCLSLNKRKRKKVFVDVENEGSRLLKKRRLLITSESNSQVVKRIYLQEVCNRLDGTTKVGNRKENKKDEKLVSLENIFINCKENNEELEFSSPVASSKLAPSPINTGSKKKKHRKLDEESSTSENETEIANVAFADSHLVDECIKRVTFCLNNNIVWQPHMPLPPMSLRIPPSAMPQGSALKKGVPPGPIHIPKPKRCSPKDFYSRKIPAKSFSRGRKWKKRGVT